METPPRSDFNLTVVLTAYRIPDERVAQFFDLNDAGFRSEGVGVILVADQLQLTKPYLRTLVFSEPMDIFNLSKTSNFGIWAAPPGVVLKTDVDIVFSAEALAEARLLAVGRGIYWIYRMASSWAERDAARLWGASRGTVALHSDAWRAVGGYDERMEGYGVEDGDLVQRARRVVRFARGRGKIWHLAHEHYGRDTGFNPLNHEKNRKLLGTKTTSEKP